MSHHGADGKKILDGRQPAKPLQTASNPIPRGPPEMTGNPSKSILNPLQSVLQSTSEANPTNKGHEPASTTM